MNPDVVVIGGGVIGAAVAYGLAAQKASVFMLDREDFQLTASRGNFGLVWLQGKGHGMPRYAQWSQEAIELWSNFAKKLEDQTGIPQYYHRTGGFQICVGEEEYSKRSTFLEEMRTQSLTGTYDCEMISRDELQNMIPKLSLGPMVSGASFCPHDGFANPLHLLRALHQAFIQLKGQFFPSADVQTIEHNTDGFLIQTNITKFSTRKLVIASGLATTKLSALVGIRVPVRPQRGQVLVTEKTDQLFPFATGRIRQNFDGSFMFGASHEEVGYDLSTTNGILQDIANHALTVFPTLKNLQLIRSWGSLRVLTPDQKPVYVESQSCPGAFAVTSHSGVSLASIHSNYLVDWILSGQTQPMFEVFDSARFDVPATA
ncbi:MAG TPA: FAD-dependent oxidoreductase [Deltaproteobacteria bacterium]|nr:FAD-dependent oxidoreductase [Deltaproteobacteria bacterium]